MNAPKGAGNRPPTGGRRLVALPGAATTVEGIDRGIGAGVTTGREKDMDELENLEIGNLTRRLYTLTLTRAIGIALCVGFASLVVIGYGHTAHHRDVATRYETLDAVIVTEPEFAYGEGNYGSPVVAATVETPNGQRISTAVPTQAHRGDTVTVYRHTATGELFRATTPGGTPLPDGTVMVVPVLITPLAALVIFVGAWRAECIVENAKREARPSFSSASR